MNKHSRLCVLAMLGAFSCTLAAQVAEPERTDTLMQRIAAIRSSLQTLDAAAEQCLTSTDANFTKSVTCQDFMAALDDQINTQLPDSMMFHCTALTTWRDAFIARNNGNLSSNDSTDSNLQLMVDIQYYCGDEALALRTNSVFPAFNLLQQEQRLSNGAISLLSLEADAYRQKIILERERARLQQSVLQGQEQSLQQTQGIQDALELELLRQQLDN